MVSLPRRQRETVLSQHDRDFRRNWHVHTLLNNSTVRFNTSAFVAGALQGQVPGTSLLPSALLRCAFLLPAIYAL